MFGEGFFALVSINYLAIIVSIIIVMALGALWYSPILFGNIWLKAIGKNKDEIDPKDAMNGMIVSLFTASIEMVVLAMLIRFVGLSGALSGLKFGIFVSVGFVATNTLSNEMFEDKNLKVWIIGIGYRVLYAGINGAILGAWQ